MWKAVLCRTVQLCIAATKPVIVFQVVAAFRHLAETGGLRNMVSTAAIIFTATVLMSLSMRRMTSTFHQAVAGQVSSTSAESSPPSSVEKVLSPLRKEQGVFTESAQQQTHFSPSSTGDLLVAIRKQEALYTEGVQRARKTCYASSTKGESAAEGGGETSRRLADSAATQKGPRVQVYPVRLLVPGLVFGDQKHAGLLQKLKLLVDSSCGLINTLGPFGGVKIELPSGTTDSDIVEIINAVKEEGFEAEPDYMVTTARALTPNDPLFLNQWGLQELQLPGAWALANTAGVKRDVRPIVCVSDTGVDYTHEDLYQNIYFNDIESLGVPDVDDDDNGYVDDIYGINVLDLTEANNPMDDESHGTHVAGTVGAVGNNRKGVTGATWNPRIIPCKFIGRDTHGSVSGAVECIGYCVSRGAKISVHSYSLSEVSVTLFEAMEQAEKHGLIMIFAGGNNGANLSGAPAYPACYSRDLEGALAVANLSRPGGSPVLNSSSNYGSCIQLGCPGTNIVSTISGHKGAAYGTKSGTSMAAALMAGVVTLMVAAKPDLSPAECRKIVKTCIVRLPSLRNVVEWQGIPDARCCVRIALTGSASLLRPSWGSAVTAGLLPVLGHLLGS